MAKIEDCPGFETFGEDVRAAREALGLTIKALGLTIKALAEHVYVDPRSRCMLTHGIFRKSN